MLDTVAQRNTLLMSIERARGSAVIAYMLHDNAVIADDALPQIYDKLQALGRRERLDLLLYARGGVPEVSWRLLNLLRDYCDHLSILVGTRVHGPASLLALGADEVVMGPLSELGEIETARKHPLLPRDELGQPIPVTFGEIKSLMRFLAENGGGQPGEDEKAPAPAASVLNAVLQQVHPLVIANLAHADGVTRDLTRKALKMHPGPDDEAQIDRLVEMFNGGSHSPLYTASRGELKEAGLNITEPGPELWSQIWGLVQLYQSTIYTDTPDGSIPGALNRYVCIVETIGRSTGLRQTFTQSEGQERIVQIRWETAVKSPNLGPGMGFGAPSNN